jgi:hypothetical protein
MAMVSVTPSVNRHTTGTDRNLQGVFEMSVSWVVVVLLTRWSAAYHGEISVPHTTSVL